LENIMAGPLGDGDSPYRSGQRSAIDNSGSDRRGRPGDPLKANPSATLHRDNQNTNKYYAEAVGEGAAVPESGGAAPGGGGRPVEPGAPVQNTQPLLLENESDVSKIRGRIIQRLEAGQDRVVVQLGSDDPGKLQRLLRTQLDLAVAREQITEEQYRDVYFAGAPAKAPPKAEQVPEAADDELPDDFDAFVKRTDEQSEEDPVDAEHARIEEETAAMNEAQAGLDATPAPEAEDGADDEDDGDSADDTDEDDTDEDDVDEDDGDSGEDAADVEETPDEPGEQGEAGEAGDDTDDADEDFFGDDEADADDDVDEDADDVDEE
jgi:hypothetical protein